MKRMLLMLLVAAVAVISGTAAGGANRVTVSPLSGDAGSEVEVTVSLDNSEALGALQVLVTLPDDADVSVVAQSAASCGRAAAFDASAGIRDGRISAMLYSLGGAAIEPGSGEVMRFRVRHGMLARDAMLAVTVKATSTDGTEIACSAAEAEFSCKCPMFELVNTSVDFGRVPLNEQRVMPVAIRNAGNAPLVVTAFDCPRSDFELVNDLPLTIGAGSSAELQVKFTAVERGQIDVAAMIGSNCPGAYNVVEISAAPYAVNTLTISPAEGVSDSEVTVPLLVDNMDAVNGFSFEITLPDGLEYVADSFELSSARGAAHTCTASQTDKVLKLMAYSMTNAPFDGKSGEIGSIRLRLAGKGSYTVHPDKVVLSAFYRGEVTNVVSDVFDGVVSITYPSIDVYSTLSLGRTPVHLPAESQLTIRNYGYAPLTISQLVFDGGRFAVANDVPRTIEPWGSAEVTICCNGNETGSLTGSLAIYSNDPDRRVTFVELSAERYSENYLSFVTKETLADAPRAMVTVELLNREAVSGFQFDVMYPAGDVVPADEVETRGRAMGFDVIRRDAGEGVSRYFVFSMSGNRIEAGSGAVLRLPFDLAEDIVPGTLSFIADNYTISTPAMENINSELSSTVFDLTLVENNVLKGDIDRNGRIGIADVLAAVAFVKGTLPVDDNLSVADIDGDGKVTLADVEAIVNAILNQ